jgi:pre-rRNA-processing protein TSR1
VQAIWDDILSDDDEEEAGVAGAGRQAMSDGVRSRRGSSKVEELEDEDEDEEEDELAGGPGFRVIDHDLTTLKGKRDAEQEQLTWPDEVEVPRDQPTKTRFQKYRGLTSFKQSAWDAFEELPLEYARIYQFENMAYTKKMLLQDEVGGFGS